MMERYTLGPLNDITLTPLVVMHRRCRRPILGDRSLCSGTLPGWGIALGAIFIAVAVSYDEEGVVLSPGLRVLPIAMWFASLSHDVIYM
jgi:hypothetical protein